MKICRMKEKLSELDKLCRQKEKDFLKVYEWLSSERESKQSIKQRTRYMNKHYRNFKK